MDDTARRKRWQHTMMPNTDYEHGLKAELEGAKHQYQLDEQKNQYALMAAPFSPMYSPEPTLACAGSDRGAGRALQKRSSC